eukprot:gene6130-10140_t
MLFNSNHEKLCFRDKSTTQSIIDCPNGVHSEITDFKSYSFYSPSMMFMGSIKEWTISQKSTLHSDQNSSSIIDSFIGHGICVGFIRYIVENMKSESRKFEKFIAIMENDRIKFKHVEIQDFDETANIKFDKISIEFQCIKMNFNFDVGVATCSLKKSNVFQDELLINESKENIHINGLLSVDNYKYLKSTKFEKTWKLLDEIEPLFLQHPVQIKYGALLDLKTLDILHLDISSIHILTPNWIINLTENETVYSMFVANDWKFSFTFSENSSYFTISSSFKKLHFKRLIRISGKDFTIIFQKLGFIEDSVVHFVKTEMEMDIHTVNMLKSFIEIKGSIEEQSIELKFPLFSRDSIELILDGQVLFPNDKKDKIPSAEIPASTANLKFKFT